MKKIVLSAFLMVAAISFANAQNVKPAEKQCNKVEKCAKADTDKACKAGKACCKNAADAKKCCKKDAKACKNAAKTCKKAVVKGKANE